MDPNIAKIIERTRARRGGLSGETPGKTVTIGGTGAERDRSPLKPRNFDSAANSAGGSPRKATVSGGSPLKSGIATASPSDAVKRLLSGEDVTSSVRELISRDSPGKSVVTRTVSTKETFTSPQRTTITKTVVTEKEETYKKEEIITYSGSAKGAAADILASLRGTENDDNKARMNQLGGNSSAKTTCTSSEFSRKSANRDEAKKTATEHTREERRVPISKFRNTCEDLATPTRDALSGRTATTTNTIISSGNNDEKRTFSSSGQPSHVATTEDGDDRFAGRKARLASLADKFRNMEDDMRHFTPGRKETTSAMAAAPASPARAHSPVKLDHLRSRSPVKEPAVRSNAMQFISSPAATTTSENRPPPTTRAASPIKPGSVLDRAASPVKTNLRSVSPTKFVSSADSNSAGLRSAGTAAIKKLVSADESLVSSLKAQGFTESESTSKLVYSFKDKNNQTENEKKEEAEANYRRGWAANRSPSPVQRPAAHLGGKTAADDVEDDDEVTFRGRSPVKRAPTVLSSPTKTVVGPTRSVSPSKPHPLQFVSPQVAAAVAAPPPPPPKPSRTFETLTPAATTKPAAARSWKIQVETPGSAVVNSAAANSDNKDERCDTPVRQTVSQKRSMFEACRPPSPPPVDPALMSLTERKALFEKNKSVPTPVARFGESVTPAMLANASSRIESSASNTEAAAWRRNKRELSPSKQMPSAKRPSPESYVISASKMHQGSPERRPTQQQEVEYAVSAKKVPPAVPPKTPSAVRKAAEIVEPSPSTPHLGRKAAELHKKLFENANVDWRANDIAQKVAEEKQREMDLLLNRYNHLKEAAGEDVINTQREQQKTAADRRPSPSPPHPPPPSTGSAASKQVTATSPTRQYPGVGSIKRVKVSPPKAGNLYPELAFESDTLSSNRSESAAESLHDSSFESVVTTHSEAPSLGHAIVAASRRQTGDHHKELSTILERNDSMDTNEDEADDELSESQVCAEIDDMLDEAMDSEEEEEMGAAIRVRTLSSSPRQAKGSASSSGSSNVDRSDSTTSWEFHTPQPVKKPRKSDGKFKTPLILRSDSPCQPNVEIEGEEGPLLHTVSFYRKQRPTSGMPMQRIVLNPVLETTAVDVESPRATISEKIRRLQDEANSQMSVISQASRALNLCRSTKEFYGSAEQVEGERLLLVATHKRVAALNEISRLKTEGGLGADPERDTSVRGTVSLCSLSLGLKKEFVQQLRSGESDDFVHYFLCLVKCSGQVIPTQMVSTLEGLEGQSLDFPNLINLTELPKNFLIQLEVYGLQTRREILDHESKYHIRKEKSMFKLTPILKPAKTESRLIRPDLSSPGGPHTVRTSSFAMVGNTVITIDSLRRKDWRLESVPPISPLSGNLTFKLNCHSESQVTHRGFLTMFDDVSGFGAWHRRWFLLEGNSLSYWKYPENQGKQAPIGSIDLGRCITETVGICPREICSRMHTFMLESSRPGKNTDRESLVLVKDGTTTILRHLLSADSREERLSWCELLNKALDNLRAWDSRASRPRTSSTSSSETTCSSATSSQSTDIW